MQLESADSKQNAITKSLIQDSFRHIFLAIAKCIILSEKKRLLEALTIFLLVYVTQEQSEMVKRFHLQFVLLYQISPV